MLIIFVDYKTNFEWIRIKIVNREYLDCGLKRSILGCRNSVPDDQSEGETWRDLLAPDFYLGPAPAVVGMWGGNE